jgi:hypothetical protein
VVRAAASDMRPALHMPTRYGRNVTAPCRPGNEPITETATPGPSLRLEPGV